MATGYVFYSLKTVFELARRAAGHLAVTMVIGTAVRGAVFRPLRTASPLAQLVASLGVLLTLQAGATLIYGTGTQPARRCCRQHSSTSSASRSRPTASSCRGSWSSSPSCAPSLPLQALRPGHPSGRESEVSAMLAGLPAERSSRSRTRSSRARRRRQRRGPRRLDDPARHDDLALAVVPALGRGAVRARFTSFGIVVRRRALAMGVIAVAASTYASTQSWFPTSDQGAALRVIERLAFLIIVVAMYVRGGELPRRGELVEQRLPAGAASRAAAPPALMRGASASWRSSCSRSTFARPDQLAGGDDHLPVLVVITGFVGQVSLVQVALAGASGFASPTWPRTPGSASRSRRCSGLGRDAVGPRRRRLRPARARRQPRGRDARRRGRDRAVRLRQLDDAAAGPAGAPGAAPHLVGDRPRAATRTSAASTATPPSPMFGFVFVGVVMVLGSSSRTSAAAISGSACSPCARTSAPRPRPASTCAT